MKKAILIILFFLTNSLAHPVSYTINLTAKYNKKTNEALIICKSDSRNKCGLHNIDLKDEMEKLLQKQNILF